MKNCWVIGASSGIGLELAKKYFQEGWNVIISSRRQQILEQIVANHPKNHHAQNNFQAQVLDVSDAQSFKIASQNVFEKFSNIDLVVFAPAIYQPMSLKEFSIDYAKETIALNLSSFFDFIELVIKPMMLQKSGKIAVIASVAGYRGLPNSLAYGASKAGLINLCEGIYPELKANNLDLAIINPGFVETRLTQKNNFAMPAIISAKEASNIIFKGLSTNKFEIHFPLKFTLLMKLIRIMPYQFYLKIINKIYLKNI